MTSTIYAKRSFKNGSLSAATNPVGTVLWDEPASVLTITVTGLSVETVGLLVSVDGGTTFSAATKPIDATTGAAAATVTLGNGTYTFNGAIRGFRISKSAASETATVIFNAVF